MIQTGVGGEGVMAGAVAHKHHFSIAASGGICWRSACISCT
jgi:hypothetical protein